MESIALTLPAALVMGLSFGAGPCNVTCLPYGPVLLAREGGGRRSWRTMAPFSAGHLAGYGALGGIAGLLGHTLQAWLRSPAVQWLLGTATILVGLALLLRCKRKGCAPHPVAHTRPLRQSPYGQAVQPAGMVLPGGLFLMGAGMALNPCAPLGAVLLAASATGSAAGGLLLGASFASAPCSSPPWYLDCWWPTWATRYGDISPSGRVRWNALRRRCSLHWARPPPGVGCNHNQTAERRPHAGGRWIFLFDGSIRWSSSRRISTTALSAYSG